MQPIYGPSHPSPYQQFYDINTGMPVHAQMIPSEYDKTEVQFFPLRNSRDGSPIDEGYGPYTPNMTLGSPYDGSRTSPLLNEEAYNRIVRDDMHLTENSSMYSSYARNTNKVTSPCDTPNPQWQPPTAEKSYPRPTDDSNHWSSSEVTPVHKGNIREMNNYHKRPSKKKGVDKHDKATPIEKQGAPSYHMKTPKTEPKRQIHRSTHIVDLFGHHDRPLIARASIELSEGDYVLVEGDRGLDMGRVHAVTSFSARPDVARPSLLPSVVRVATPEEVKLWTTTLLEEANAAVPICQEAAEQLGINITITAASYQFDRQKLSFYYDSAQRIDFRRILPPMFTKFRCRIWLERNEAC